MRFRIVDGATHLYLSEREEKKYGLPKDSVVHLDSEFKPTKGKFSFSVNGFKIPVNIEIKDTPTGQQATIKVKQKMFKFEKVGEINKYDCIRHIIRWLKEIKGS